MIKFNKLKYYFKGDNPETLTKAIKYAISIGYRHFDLAWLYGNEDVIGTALRAAIDESNGKLKREDFFLVSKVWNTFHSKGIVMFVILHKIFLLISY